MKYLDVRLEILPREFNNFLSSAKGSSFGLQTQLILPNKLNLISEEVLELLLLQIDKLQKMNHGFQKMLIKKQRQNNIRKDRGRMFHVLNTTSQIS